ncbi:MAG: hypothetical protein AAGG55_08645 [Pseudomonadota bacterium]
MSSRRARRRQKRRIIAAVAALTPALLAFVFAVASEDSWSPTKRDARSGVDRLMEARKRAGAGDIRLPGTSAGAKTPSSRSVLSSISEDMVPLEESDDDLSTSLPSDTDLRDAPEWSVSDLASVGGPGARGFGFGRGSFAGSAGRSGRSGATGGMGFGGGFDGMGGMGGFGGGIALQNRSIATESIFDDLDIADITDPLDPEELFDDLTGSKRGNLPPDFDPCPPGGLVVSPCYIPFIDPCPPGGLVVSPCIQPRVASVQPFAEFDPPPGNTPPDGPPPPRRTPPPSNPPPGDDPPPPQPPGDDCLVACTQSPPPDDPPTPVPAPAPVFLLGLGLAFMLRSKARRN